MGKPVHGDFNTLEGKFHDKCLTNVSDAFLLTPALPPPLKPLSHESLVITPEEVQQNDARFSEQVPVVPLAVVTPPQKTRAMSPWSDMDYKLSEIAWNEEIEPLHLPPVQRHAGEFFDVESDEDGAFPFYLHTSDAETSSDPDSTPATEQQEDVDEEVGEGAGKSSQVSSKSREDPDYIPAEGDSGEDSSVGTTVTGEPLATSQVTAGARYTFRTHTADIRKSTDSDLSTRQPRSHAKKLESTSQSDTTVSDPVIKSDSGRGAAHDPTTERVIGTAVITPVSLTPVSVPSKRKSTMRIPHPCVHCDIVFNSSRKCEAHIQTMHGDLKIPCRWINCRGRSTTFYDRFRHEALQKVHAELSWGGPGTGPSEVPPSLSSTARRSLDLDPPSAGDEHPTGEASPADEGDESVAPDTAGTPSGKPEKVRSAGDKDVRTRSGATAPGDKTAPKVGELSAKRSAESQSQDSSQPSAKKVKQSESGHDPARELKTFPDHPAPAAGVKIVPPVAPDTAGSDEATTVPADTGETPPPKGAEVSAVRPTTPTPATTEPTVADTTSGDTDVLDMSIS
jgi:hypothetical protein